MKGFYISVKNDLLEPKHRKAMGSSVWEFMWLLDKLTSITEDGEGIVLGGGPIKLELITKELGIKKNTVSENLTKLKNSGYININRVAHGLIITVNKASKRFNQKKGDNNTVKPVYKTERVRKTDILRSENRYCTIDNTKDHEISFKEIREGLQKYRFA